MPGDNALPAPTASFAIIWQPQWQKELAFSDSQKAELREIHARAMAELKERAEAFKKLSPEEQKAQAVAMAGRPAAWRQEFDRNLHNEIKALLTPEQLQAIKEFSFPSQAVGLLYHPTVRQAIDFTQDQEDALRNLARERLSKMQALQIEEAAKVWGILTSEQQAALPDLVKKQAPTAAILSIAAELGFDLERCLPGYLMLSESPVRERLQLSNEQKLQLDSLATECVAKKAKAREQPSAKTQPAPSGLPWEAEARAKVEAILTPQQLTTLGAIDFRRQVALTLARPEKRQALGITAEQTADLQRFISELHDEQYRIDREMLDRAMKILTPRQREQIQEEINRRSGD
jgi:hypothetical protein